MINSDRELLRLVPRVLRARDFHLYIEGGKRLTDLWRDGGKAALGHKPPKVLLELKNAAERGLFAHLPHPAEKRLVKALEEIFPERAFRFYNDFYSMRRALDTAGHTGQISLWRPFLEEKVTDTIFTPVLPWLLGPEVLVLEKSLDASFPAGEIIPPVLLAPAARSLYDLTARIRSPNLPRYRKIEMLFNKPNSSGQNSLWRRQGIYLTVDDDMPIDEYKSLFLRFLEDGFLIPPSPAEPAILPFSMSAGEEAKLVQLLAN